MFVSSKMYEIWSSLMFLGLWELYYFFSFEDLAWQVFSIAVGKVAVKTLISYLSCRYVSRIQSTKTMSKILISCNLKLN